MTLREIENIFPKEKDAIERYIHIKHHDVLLCPKCDKIIKISSYNKGSKAYQCKKCDKMFSVFSGTIFEKSSTDIRIWFFAIYLILNEQKRITARQLQRDTRVSYKCAWRMLKLIRLSLENDESAAKCWREIICENINVKEA